MTLKHLKVIKIHSDVSNWWYIHLFKKYQYHIDIGDVGSVFTWYWIDIPSYSIAYRYCFSLLIFNGRKENPILCTSIMSLICLLVLVPPEPDLWDHTDSGPGLRGGLSAGSAGPEDQAAPEPPGGTGFRRGGDQIQQTCAQTAWQRSEVSGELGCEQHRTKRMETSQTLFWSKYRFWKNRRRCCASRGEIRGS